MHRCQNGGSLDSAPGSVLAGTEGKIASARLSWRREYVRSKRQRGVLPMFDTCSSKALQLLDAFLVQIDPVQAAD